MENVAHPLSRSPNAVSTASSARVVPLHGARSHAPSSLLVRARLPETLVAERIRAAVALLAEVCDGARRAAVSDAGRWWTAAMYVEPAAVAADAPMTLTEAEAALADLETARLLVPLERGHRIDADVLCECPALLRFDLDVALARVRREPRRVAASVALLREVVRLADAEGAAQTTLPRLQHAVLYGRTRLTQSIGQLEALDLLRRADLPNRMVRLQLLDPERSSSTLPTPAASPSPSASVSPGSSRSAGRMRLPAGMPLQIGGQTLEVLPGMIPELERGDDGRYYLWLGPVRIGPYDG